MATTFYLRNIGSTLGGSAQFAWTNICGQSSTTAPPNTITTTVAGGTNIPVTGSAGGATWAWFTEPLTRAVTVSGTLNVTIYGSESANTVNAGLGILVERTDSAGTVISAVVNDVTIPATISEYTVSASAKADPALTPTSTTFNAGDRIKLTLKVRNVGTMGAGSAFNHYNARASGNGFSSIRFTEDISTDEIGEIPNNQYGSNGYYG